MSLRDYFRFSPPFCEFAIGDAVVLADGRTGQVIRREFDMRPAVIAYHVMTQGVTVVARPDTLQSYLEVRTCA